MADCSSLHSPLTSDICNPDACPTYTWQSGPWSSCSQACGGGTQTQPVLCLSSVGNSSVSLALCTPPAPLGSQACNIQACTGNHWVSDAWGQCTVLCGGGTQTRSVTCAAANGSPLSSGSCSGCATTPASTQACNTAPCITYDWISCPPLPCTAQCNGDTGMLGITYIDVWCQTSTGQPADPSLCSSPLKPATSISSCNPQKCQNFNWMANANWGPCLSGYRNRSFHCHAADGSLALYSQCQAKAGPLPASVLPCVPDGCLKVPPTPNSYASSALPFRSGLELGVVLCVLLVRLSAQLVGVS